MKLHNLEKILNNYEDKIALIIDEESVTYRELIDNAKIISNNLLKEKSNNVIVYGHKEKYMIFSFIACLFAKKTYIPVDISTPYDRIKKIISDSKSRLIITEYKDTFELKKISLEKTLTKHKFTLNTNNIAYIMYTSGSTGNPKGVPISRNNLENFINWISNSYLKKYKSIKVLNQANYNFDLSIADIYYSLINGHTLVTTNKSVISDLDSVFRLVKINEINLFIATPTFIKLLLINRDFNNKNYKSIKCIYFCGEILDISLVNKIKKRFKNIAIINAYGPTEATSAVSMIKITNKMLSDTMLPIGRINKCASEICINNGEIIIKGKSVFGGYLGIESSNVYKENKRNCYKTGDYGYIKNNLLYFKCRKDDVIKYKGYRIDLNDIRINILKIKDVIDVYVTTTYCRDKVKHICAYITGINLEAEIIKKDLNKLLPSYMIPSKIFILDKIKFNNNFKQKGVITDECE